MSKIGRRPILFGEVQVEVKGQEVHYKGKNNSGTYFLPEYLTAVVEGKTLGLSLNDKEKNNFWGMHRALLANILQGAEKDFEKLVEITGLGYKGVLSGSNITFSLGYSHKIDLELPQNVKVVIDKTGQKLNFSSFDKEAVGQVCAKIRALRPPEPYKLTGIKVAGEVIRKKAGKAKGAE